MISAGCTFRLRAMLWVAASMAAFAAVPAAWRELALPGQLRSTSQKRCKTASSTGVLAE